MSHFRRRLETLILAVLFNVLALVFLNSSVNAIQEKKQSNKEVIIESDIGIVKIRDKYYFLGDIIQFLKQVDRFICLTNDNFFLKTIGLDERKLNYLKNLNDSNYLQYKDDIKTIINIIVIQEDLYQGRQDHGLKLVEDLKKLNQWQKCAPKDMEQMIDNWPIKLLVAHSVYKERFRPMAFGLSKTELESEKLRNPLMGEEQVKQHLVDKKIKKAAELFTHSILNLYRGSIDYIF